MLFKTENKNIDRYSWFYCLRYDDGLLMMVGPVSNANLVTCLLSLLFVRAPICHLLFCSLVALCTELVKWMDRQAGGWMDEAWSMLDVLTWHWFWLLLKTGHLIFFPSFLRDFRNSRFVFLIWCTIVQKQRGDGEWTSAVTQITLECNLAFIKRYIINYTTWHDDDDDQSYRYRFRFIGSGCPQQEFTKWNKKMTFKKVNWTDGVIKKSEFCVCVFGELKKMCVRGQNT